MSRTLLSIACHAYGLAAILYLVNLVKQWRVFSIVGRGVIAIGLVLHGVALGAAVVNQGGMPLGIGQGLSAIALALLAIFLALDLRYRKPVLGAFLTPIALAVLVPGLLIHGGSTALSPDVRRPLLPVHIAIALLGVAAFAVAAGVALMYVLMERQVKGKRFGLLFSRLPSLEFLDELNRRFVVAGFILLSITLATGAFFASGTGGIFWQWEPKEIATLVAWIIFAAVLGARSLAGWQGRRVALITMAGFGVLLVSLVTSYPLRGGALP
jgi:ABC-type uncharacterized transport system permease subunit